MIIFDCGRASKVTKGHPFPTVFIENALPPFTYCLRDGNCFPLKPEDMRREMLESLKEPYEPTHDPLR